jgi:hypothetical protein
MPRFFATIALLLTLAAVTPASWADDTPPPGDTATAPAAAGPPTAAAAPDPAPAPAASSPTTPPAPSVDRAVTALRTGNWRLLAAVVLAFVMAGLGRLRARVAWLRGDRGGALLVGLLALLGTLSVSLEAGAPIDGRLLLSALAITWTAVGGYTWVKRLIWPTDAKVTTTTVEVTVPSPSPDRFVTELRAKFDAAAAAPPAGPGGV